MEQDSIQAIRDRLKHLRYQEGWAELRKVLEDEIESLTNFLISNPLTQQSMFDHIIAQTTILAYQKVLALPEYLDVYYDIHPAGPDRDNQQEESED